MFMMRNLSAWVVILTIAGQVAPLHCRAQSTAPSLLTEQQTMDLVFLPSIYGKPWDLYRLANPKAIEAIRKVRQSEELRPYHMAAWRVIAFVGDKTDVKGIDDLLRQPSLPPVLDRAGQDEIEAAMQCLGLLYKRDVEGAGVLLESLLDPAVWEKVPFKWSTANEKVAPKYQMFCLAAEGYALSGKTSFDDLIQQRIDAIADAQSKEYLNGRIRAERLRAYRQAFERAQQESKLLAAAASRFNGDMNHPGPATATRAAPTVASEISRPPANNAPWVEANPEEQVFAGKMLQDATTAYADLSRKVLAGQFDALRGNLLDNGEVLRPRANWEEGKRDLVREQDVLLEPSVAKATAKDIRIDRHLNYQMDNLGGKSQLRETITVTWQLPGTAEIAKKMFPGNPSESIAPNGNFVVLMKRINGVWYWNPFGW
jgi:hypothetical protein